MTSAWAWVVLSIVLAIVYLWTSVAKLDPVWSSGACLRQLTGTAALIGPWEKLIGPSVWPLTAKLTVVVELIIAIGYLLAPWLDRSSRRGTRIVQGIFLAIIMGLHISFEVAGLHIGWFSWHMIILAVSFFAPVELLNGIVGLVDRTRERLVGAVRSLIPSSFQQCIDDNSMIWLVAFVAVMCLLGTGYWVDLPGAVPACGLAAVVAAAITIRRRDARIAVAFVVAALMLIVTVAATGERSQYYAYRLGEMHRQGRTELVQELLPHAKRHISRDDLHGQHNLAWVLATTPDESLRDGELAVEYAKRTCELVDYNNASALDLLAWSLAAKGDFRRAADAAAEAAGLLRGVESPLLREIQDHQKLFAAGKYEPYRSPYRY